MRKGEQTRQHIIQQAALLFNKKGYTTVSMSDLTAATGLQRGGLYNHFGSKEELAAESFAYAAHLVGHALREKLDATTDPLTRLQKIATAFYEVFLENDVFPCGCPVLNTAIEAKRHMTTLRNKAQEAMNILRTLVADTVADGLAQGRLTSPANPDEVATVFIAVLEGAMVLSMLYDDPVHLDRAVNHLHHYAGMLAA